MKTYPCGRDGEVLVDKLHDSLYVLRVNDKGIRFFEALWEIPEGITYNSYLVTGPEKTVLLDTVKAGFADCFLEALESITDVESISDLVVHHSEPDHSGAIPRLLERNEKITVHSHPVARNIIEKTYGVKLNNYCPLRNGLRLELGGDYVLEFIATPWLHWPDTYMSILEPHGVLFSGDVFGAYSVPSQLSDRGVNFEKYAWFMKKYFVTVIGSYRDWVVKGMDKLEDYRNRFNTVAPLHGLVLEENVDRAIELYRFWGEKHTIATKATVVYVSMYGGVEKAARRAAELLASKGYRVSVYGFNDSERALVSDVLGDAIDSGLLVVGAPTYEASVVPLMKYIAELLCDKAGAGQKVVILTSYGWGGAAGKRLENILKSCGMSVRYIVEKHGSIDEDELVDAIEALTIE